MKSYDPKMLGVMRQLNAGYMPTDVLVQNVATTLDRWGNPSLVYTTVATLKGQVAEVSGQEQRLVDTLRSQGRLQTLVAVLRLPWGSSVTEDQVIDLAGVKWNVAAVVDQESLGTVVKVIITDRRVAPGERGT